MPCFRPLTGWLARVPTKAGKRSVVFKASEGWLDRPVQVPCGRCDGCLVRRSSEWATRCVNESSLHSDNCALTLTYCPQVLPSSLVPRHLQLFWKRLRKEVGKFRYFACGEYGSKFDRPHYHAVVFGFRPFDLSFYKNAKDGSRLYTSDLLTRIWGLGFVVVGDVSFASAGYVAKYISKKVVGPLSEAHYGSVVPEFVVCSNRRGIGFDWATRYMDEYSYDDKIALADGRESNVPRYYMRLLEKSSPEAFERVSALRRVYSSRHSSDNVGDRLAVRERVLKARLSLSDRRFDVRS